MSVVGKGRRCGRVVACRSGLFTTSNSLALVLLTASPAAAQSAAEGNRNPTALPQVTIEAPKPRRPTVRRYADRKPSRYFGTPLINGRLDESLRFTNFNVGDSNIHYRDSWTRLKTEWDVNNDVSIHNVL